MRNHANQYRQNNSTLKQPYSQEYANKKFIFKLPSMALDQNGQPFKPVQAE